MVRKYHNHTLQTNPRYREEEPQNIYSNKTYVKPSMCELISFYFITELLLYEGLDGVGERGFCYSLIIENLVHYSLSLFSPYSLKWFSLKNDISYNYYVSVY